ncbi:hypothetical protein GGI12_002661 [Dipsacomyces acuminosporus]|nr:hypothetical protein GGI12_002661 [Dipsacomyces acuminosporus]
MHASGVRGDKSGAVAAEANDIPETPEAAPAHNVQLLQFEPYPVPGAALWEQFTDESASQWKHSGALKKGEQAAQYDGEWAIEEVQKLAGVEGDKALVVKSEARHHAISRRLAKPFDPAASGLVLQYEVKLQENLNCGGAYIKLLTAPSKGEFSNESPYTLMFGPDKCGESKLHLIYRHLNPLSGNYTEHHLDQSPTPPTDHLSHLYTLTIHTNNTFSIAIDGTERRTGSLLDDFVPPVNPPKEIEDSSDKKPEDWDDNEKIPDPDAKKPDDWDEDAPLMIPDENAVIPKGWLENEPLMVEDPNAQKPADWDDEEDGDWSAPMVPNPRCVDAAGCGPWERPMMRNPNFRGQWFAPLIDNPRYKGEWAPRRIPNPEYFEDLDLYKLSKIDAVGFELWTMQSGITFDNIYLGDSAETAEAIGKSIWKPKFDVESAIEEATRPKPPPAPATQVPAILDLIKVRFFEITSHIESFYTTLRDEGAAAAISKERRGIFAQFMIAAALGWLLWNAFIVCRFVASLFFAATSSGPASGAGSDASSAASDDSKAVATSSARAAASSGTAAKRNAATKSD